jgi:non-ribosomal peptide synthetase component E (peptide arylation enzyme)
MRCYIFSRQKRFASYKLPERLEVIDKLPMAGDEQKVDKTVLEKEVINRLHKVESP